ncbi:MAG: aminotransferase class V-fold PLP-dependent enzyme [Gemmatimonadales bacterium]|nr:aminotransferase class V-fold PLP-dependent enzyme [Gemmatimonadales bacterium]
MTPLSARLSTRYDLAALRQEEFPWAESRIFLNHASTGPLPERTRRAIDAFNADRADGMRISDERLQGVLREAREVAARLINAEVGEIALATNTSFGINLAARMLPLEPGSIVLVSEGEFPANVFPWRRLADRGASAELLPLTAEGWPDENAMIERMADPRVRVLAISHVQFHTGYRADLDRLGRAARATGTWLVVDAIQALGHLPFDVKETPVDILACGGQKWLLSPWGSGFMYVRKELVPRLASPFAGWMAFDGTSDFTTLLNYDLELHRDARRFELVTLPFQDFLGMNRSLDLLDELGPANIEAHVAGIGEPVRAWAERRGVRMISPTNGAGSGMLCLAAEDVPGGFEALRDAGVVCSVREGALRLAPHCYNTIDELNRVAEILESACKA